LETTKYLNEPHRRLSEKLLREVTEVGGVSVTGIHVVYCDGVQRGFGDLFHVIFYLGEQAPFAAYSGECPGCASLMRSFKFVLKEKELYLEPIERN